MTQEQYERAVITVAARQQREAREAARRAAYRPGDYYPRASPTPAPAM